MYTQIIEQNLCHYMKISNDVFFIEREPIFEEQLCYDQGGGYVSI